MSKFDNVWTGTVEEEITVPEDAARVLMARDMDERVELLKRMRAHYFAKVEDYEGWACIKVWEKTHGEVGPCIKTWRAPEIDGEDKQ